MLIAAIVLSGAFQATDWKTYPTVDAFGEERFLDGAPKRFRALHSRENTLVATSRAIDGTLTGVTRYELRTPTHISTSLEARPGWALELPVSSTPDYDRMLAPPRFSKTQLLGDVGSIEHAIGRTVKRLPDETLLGRKCFVVEESGAGPTVDLWLDQETGIALQREELTAGHIYLQITLTSLELKSDLMPMPIEAPSSPQVFRGVPSADILLKAGSTQKPSYEADIKAMKEKSKFVHGSWINSISPPKGFDYVGSHVREVVGAPAYRRSPGTPANSKDPELDPYTGQPESQQFTFAISQDDLVVGQLNSESEVAITAVASEAVAQELDARLFRADVTFVLANGDRTQIDAEAKAGAKGIVQSDFLDPKTGDTVTFFQCRNAKIDGLLHGLNLPKPIEEKGEGGPLLVYRCTRPIKLTVVSWSDGEGSYALASSRLTATELKALRR